MRHRILVVAEDVTLRSTLARWLMPAGCFVELAETDRRAREVLADQRMALTIVAPSAGVPMFDPGEKGGKLIIATERSHDPGRLSRSAPVADAYLSIPLDEQEVLAQVDSVLRPPPDAKDAAPQTPEILSFDGFTIDLAGRSLRDSGGSEVPLTHAEFALLVVLARHPGRVLSRDQLLDAALGRRAEPYDRSIDVLVSRLRRKIEPDPKVPRFIVTMLGEGYKFAAPLRESYSPAQTTFGAPAEEPSARPPSNERRQLTVMSCGLLGSAALAARLDPEDLRALLADYHRCCADVIAPFGGMVALFSGDRIVAYFGYPGAHENDAERAVRAGLAIVEAVAKLASPFAASLHVRVGIASGLVVTDCAAPDGVAHQPVAIGEAPELAAQLQSVAPPDKVVIAASTRDLVRGLFDYHELGRLALEGLDEPVPAWQVVGASAAESRFEALREGALTPLIGRDEEIDLLLRRWQQIQSGEGRVVLISGEPGIGKSRLVRALRDRLGNNTVLSFYCSPHHQDSPLYPVIAQLERAAGFRRDDDPEERLAKFEALLHPSISTDAVTLLAALLSVPVGELYPPPNLNPQRRKQRTLEALVAQLGLASERPVLAVFEDAHWMDATSRELLDAIIDRARSLPVLLVITYRPEFTPPWIGHAQATTLVLTRLGNREVTAIADHITGKRLPREIHRQIIELSDGVPLFVEELVKTVLESGLLHELNREDLINGPVSPLAIPDTLQGLLIARIDRLGPARQVAQTGAALGREFSYEAIRAVADWLPEQQLQEGLQALVQSELLYCRGTPPDAAYLFKHALVQDAAHKTLLRSRRRELHARIAAVLEERFPEVADQQPGLLAQHHTEAGSLEQAVIYWGKAGRQSAARSAMIEAEAQLRRGLRLIADLPDSRERKRQELDLQVTLAAALMESRGHVHPEVAEVLGRARSLIVETEAAGTILHFSVLYGLWVAQYLGGEPVAAVAQADEFLSLAESQTQSGLVLVGHRLVGSALVFAGKNYPAALSHLDRAVELYRPEEHRELAFRFGADIGITAQCARALALWHRGYPDQARRALEQGLRDARQSIHRHTLAFALIYKGLTAISARWAAESEEAANELVAHTREYGFALFLGYGLLLQAGAMTLRGQGAAAVERIHEGVAAMRATGMNRAEPMVLCYLAEALALTGAVVEGFKTLAAGSAAAETSGTHWADPELHRLRGELLGRLPSADWREVESCFRTARAVAREQGSRGFELRAAVSLARLLCTQGRQDEARDLLAPVYGSFTEGFGTQELKDARTLLADLA